MIDSLTFARSVTLSGSVLTALSSGTNYVYSAYAPQLGSRLHITYTQLNMIGLSGNMGKYTTGPVIGRVVDKRGPRPLLIASSILLFSGYIGLRRYFDAGPSSDENLPSSSLIVMSILSFMTGAGSDAGLTAATNSTAKSFPDRMRATTIGLVLAGFGLSAFLFSTLAQWFFPGNTSQFLLILSLGTSLPVIIGLFTVRPIRHVESPNDAGPEGVVSLSRENGRSSLSADQGNSQMMGRVSEGDNEVDDVDNIELTDVGRSESSVHRVKHLPVSENIDTHGMKMITGWEFWLLFTILSLLSGTGLMFINNVGTISQALSAKGNSNYDKVAAGKRQAAQVSLISLANCAARLGIGASADLVKSRFAGHRSYLLSLVSLLFIISQIVGSQVEHVDHLWQASLLLGLGHGGIFGLLPTITIEWFGMAHFSENWGFVSLAPLLGGNLFSILFGRNLDAHVPTAMTTPTTTNILRAPQPRRQCLEGRVCYASTLGVTTFACLVALGLSLVAAWRDRRMANIRAGEYVRLPQVIWQDGAEE